MNRLTPSTIARLAPVPLALALVLVANPGVTKEAGDVIFLEQGMSDADRETYSWTPLGSQLIPYTWFVALEDPKTGKMFKSDEVMGEWGIPPGAPVSKGNPDGLPRGFVKDGNRDWFGLTCAACHSNEITYEGKRIHIDGGGTMADIDGWGFALNQALVWTRDTPEAWDRFAERVLGEGAKEKKVAALRQEFEDWIDFRLDYGKRNHPGVVAGMGRHDSMGVLFTTSGAQALGIESNRFDRMGPVSLPHTWEVGPTAQWNGFGSMVGLGKLGRDIGVSIGLFSNTTVERKAGRVQYKSSVRTTNLIHLGKVGRSMTHPEWPEFFPAVDQDKATQGEALFTEHCSECHAMKPNDPSVLVPLDEIGTDPAMALQFTRTMQKTGALEGVRKHIIAGEKFGPEAPAWEIMQHVVIGVLVADPTAFASEPGGAEAWLRKIEEVSGADESRQDDLESYRARPLHGIWATAPYLHNGSVRNLWQLMLPPDQRETSFMAGRIDFDPVDVGLAVAEEGPGRSVIDTTKPGNRATGHDHGTDLSEDEKRAIIEFLKVL